VLWRLVAPARAGQVCFVVVELLVVLSKVSMRGSDGEELG
jgi:hypothetical protein